MQRTEGQQRIASESDGVEVRRAEPERSSTHGHGIGAARMLSRFCLGLVKDFLSRLSVGKVLVTGVLERFSNVQRWRLCAGC